MLSTAARDAHPIEKQISMSKAVVWFRKDLRLDDNEVLHKAIQNEDELLFFYCFEASEFGKTSFGFAKTDSYRAQFLIESVSDLRQRLAGKGVQLIVRVGETADHLKTLVEQSEVEKIYTSKAIHQEEIAIQERVEEIPGIQIDYSFGSTLYHVNDLPHHYKDTPKVFTAFRKAVEKHSKVRKLIPEPFELKASTLKIEAGDIPTLSNLGIERKERDPRAATLAKGGETEAMKRLEEYLFGSEALSTYKETRNGLLGENYSSKFSLWLWNGCISPRRIYWEIKEYENQIKKNQSTYWLVFELIWRDFFKYMALQNGNRIFHLNGLKETSNNDWSTDRETFDRWASAETGVPFIDANMKELNLTGFMSNRGRQNVASFLVKDLGIDWRMGAEYFESKLIDYDVASNYGNWMYIAGVGNDPRDRYFNVINQAKRYDPHGDYVKYWIPDLADVSAEYIHHPWTESSSLFKEQSYPQPIVEPDYWKKYY